MGMDSFSKPMSDNCLIVSISSGFDAMKSGPMGVFR